MADGGLMMDLSNSTVTWRGITFSGVQGTPFGLGTLDGWDELPPDRRESTPRPQAHGTFDEPVWSDERTVMLTGGCNSPAERDALHAQLGAAMTFSGRGSAELVIDHAGRTLTAFAQLVRFKAPMGENWARGYFTYAAQWVCSDPLRYGAPVSVSTGFPVLAGGLEYDLYTDGTTDTGFLEYGAASATGRLLVANPGNEDAWPQFEMTGPVPVEGVEIVRVGTGERLRFEGGVSTGSVLVLDSASGAVVIDGYADRSGLLTIRDWTSVPAGGSAEFEFVPLGSFSAAMLVATVSPGWW